MTGIADRQLVTGGVDTHKDLHAAAAIDQVGGLLGVAEFPADPAGYAKLLAWLTGFGDVVQVGVEGTGSYGAGLARHLHSHNVAVVEVDRPDRRTRRRRGKSDPLDAEAAARAALSGVASGTPKTGDGNVESIRVLRLARRSAVKARTQTANQLHALVVAAPEPLRGRLRGLALHALVGTAARMQPGTDLTDPVNAVKTALRSLARRHQQLDSEIAELSAATSPLVTQTAPALLELPGVGPETAGQLLVTAGDNPERMGSEASFAALCGVAPLPASSGRTTGRHRLNRGGDRAANNALHMIMLTRKRYCPRTRAYVTRRTAEGLSNRDITRCLKRYVAREIYKTINPRGHAQERAATHQAAA